MVFDMPDTRTALLTEATRLVRRRGYAAFSYADLSAAVGVTKASIHHHFPTKADLGEELVVRYTAAFRTELHAIGASDPAAAVQLRRYAALYRAGLDADQPCLCGVLAAEVEVIAPGIRQAVSAFFEANIAWLTEVVMAGQRTGGIRAELDAALAADGLLAAMQGGMLLARGMRDVSAFDRAARSAIGGVLA
jgi:TetR/AcrR family transcriptional regulator, transcriptional repressor for nem operon